ncbi:MAG TPA: OB-fold nucleic acid binding domain-containing protein, partial [Candidatus Xenobia bacterium]
ILGGAFDVFKARRSQLWMGLAGTIEYGQHMQRDSSSGQASLFDLDDEATEPELPALQEFDKAEVLAAEKELLGIHMSDSPLTEYATLLSKPPFVPIQKLADLPPSSRVAIGGMIVTAKRILTKKNLPMAFLEVEDLTGTIEVTVLPQVYEKYAAKIALNGVVSVKGKLEMRQSSSQSTDEEDEVAEEMKMLGEEIAPLSSLNRFWSAAQADTPEARLPKPPSLAQLRGKTAEPETLAPAAAPTAKPFYLQVGDMSDWSSRSDDRQEGVAAITPSAPPPPPPPPAEGPRPGIHMRVAMEHRQRLPALKALLADSRGAEAVYLHLESPEGRTTLSLGPDFSVRPSQDFIRNAENLLGQGTIQVHGVETPTG